MQKRFIFPNFHMKGFAPGLALKQRRKATRKSPIASVRKCNFTITHARTDGRTHSHTRTQGDYTRRHEDDSSPFKHFMSQTRRTVLKEYRAPEGNHYSQVSCCWQNASEFGKGSAFILFDHCSCLELLLLLFIEF